MSISSWKKEFYSNNPTKKMSKVEAIEHSLRKWEGLSKSNLKKHGLQKYNFDNSISYMDEKFNTDSFSINDESCALCKKYMLDDDIRIEECSNCPLFLMLGHSCDNYLESPYYTYYAESNPQPMIRALRKLLKQAQKEI